MFDKLQAIISKLESKGADFVDARYDELLISTIIKDNERIEEYKTTKRAGVGFNLAPSCYRIENGEITNPLEPVSVAGNLYKAFNQIMILGN